MWNVKHFPSVLKGFQLPKIVSDLKPFQEIFNKHVANNTVRYAMACDVYFPFPKVA